MQFQQIPGQEIIKGQLIARLKDHKVAHAQLFLGAKGSPNLALARAFAQYLQCKNPSEQDSCGRCPSCHKHSKLIHPDLHFVFPVSTTSKVKSKPISQDFLKDWRSFLLEHPYPSLEDWLENIGAENKQGRIAVDESRQIIRSLALKSYESDYKVLLLWLPETMNISAANSLLKILEEPPPRTIFIMVSEDEKNLLSTIRSRVQFVQIPSFQDEEVEHYLTEKTSLAKLRIQEISYLSDGNMHEALRQIEAPEEASFPFFREWMREAYSQNLTALVKRADSFNALKKEEQKSLIYYALNIFRETLLSQEGESKVLRLGGERAQFVQGFTKTLNYHQIEVLYTKFNEALYHLERNANVKLLFLNLSLNTIPVFRN